MYFKSNETRIWKGCLGNSHQPYSPTWKSLKFLVEVLILQILCQLHICLCIRTLNFKTLFILTVQHTIRKIWVKTTETRSLFFKRFMSPTVCKQANKQKTVDTAKQLVCSLSTLQLTTRLTTHQRVMISANGSS